MVVLLNWFAVASLAGVHLASGNRLLKWFGWQGGARFENTLLAAGVSFGATSLAVFFMGIAGVVGPAAMLVWLLSLAVVAGKAGWKEVGLMLAEARAGAVRAASSSKGLALLMVLAVLLLAGWLAAAAPVTGSDALSYHLDVPRAYLEAGAIVPVYSKLNSFFSIGSGHMLILLGMALGGDGLALGLCYLGGLLTVGVTYAVARQYLPREFSLLAALVVAATPMVFWQMSVAGAPDMWTTFYTMLAALGLVRWLASKNAGALLLCGAFAGMAASSKYTGGAVALILAGMVAYYSRSSASLMLRCLALFSTAVVLVGVWRHVVYMIWTGDPLFPFLSKALGVADFNAFTYEKIALDTRAPEFALTPLRLLAYPLLLTLDGSQVGIGQYFGPVLLSCAPVMLLSIGASRLKPILVICVAFFLTNWATSQVGRFLLPVFPLAVVLGVHALWWLKSQPGLRLAPPACGAMVAAFVVFGLASNLYYAGDFLGVVAGLETREGFLSRMAPDYNISSVVNRHLGGKQGKVMVFFRHTYYLRVPFVNGDPRTSWLMDPDQLNNPEALLAKLREQEVEWVVKSSDYPSEVKQQFEELEAMGVLRQVASAEAENFAGKRIYKERRPLQVSILNVVAEGSGLRGALY